MLDFAPIRDRKMTIGELTADLSPDDLRTLTNEMLDTIRDLIQACTDEDVVFEPDDPEAHDSYAEDEADIDLAWNLGHVVVHVTASLEESAALAAELARGVPLHGRSRSEVAWQTVTRIDQCFHRLEESRRMCMASLDMWPDKPHLDLYYQRNEESPKINAIGRYVFGLMHSDSHLDQIREIVRQAKAVTA